MALIKSLVVFILFFDITFYTFVQLLKMDKEEKILIQQLKKGNPAAFEKIYKDTYPLLYSYILNFLENRLFAEDVLEEIFVNLWEKKETLQIEASIKSYLFKSAKNACLDFVRKKNVRESYRNRIEKKYNIEKSFDLFSTNETYILENTELKSALQKAINNLPRKCRKVFKLSRYFKYKNKEIARLLKISEPTVEMHLRTAITKLKGALREFLT